RLIGPLPTTVSSQQPLVIHSLVQPQNPSSRSQSGAQDWMGVAGVDLKGTVSFSQIMSPLPFWRTVIWAKAKYGCWKHSSEQHSVPTSTKSQRPCSRPGHVGVPAKA